MRSHKEDVLEEPQEDALEVAHLKRVQQQQQSTSPSKPREKVQITDADVDSLKALLERQSRRLAEQERQQQVDASHQPSSAAKEKSVATSPLPEWAKAMAQPQADQLQKKEKKSLQIAQENTALSKDLVQIKADMKSLRELLMHQVSSLMDDHREREEPLRCMLEKHLQSSQFSQEVAKRLTEMVADYPPDSLLNHLPRALANMLSVQRDDIVHQGGVVALVGPTGVGKTTTLA